jgi:hypothetical protein
VLKCDLPTCIPPHSFTRDKTTAMASKASLDKQQRRFFFNSLGLV